MIVAREDDYGNKPLLDAPENTPPKDAKFTPNQTHIIPSEEGVGTVMGSTLNVANCAIGAGVLAFPSAFMDSGSLLGPILCFVLASFMASSLHVLAMASKSCGGRTYQETLKWGIGGKLGHICEVVLESTVYIYVLGCGVGFLNVVSDQIEPIINNNGGPLNHRSVLIIIIASFIALPLCMVRNINDFVWTSYFAVISIIYMACVVISYGIKAEVYGDSFKNHFVNSSATAAQLAVNASDWDKVFKAIPIICYAFNCHLAFIPIFQELRRTDPSTGKEYRTVKNMDRVAMGAYAICGSLYILVGVFGYMLFGNDTPDDILSAMPKTSESCPPHAPACPYDIHVARLSIAVAVLSLYPKLQWVARTCIDDLLVDQGYVQEVKVKDTRYIPQKRFLAETFFYVIVTTAISCIEPSITDVMDFIGATLAGLQVFVFPGLLYWKVKEKEHKAKGEGFTIPLYTWLNIFLAVFMCVCYYATL